MQPGSVTWCPRVIWQVWTLTFFNCAYNLLNNRPSYRATKFEEQHILLKQRKLLFQSFQSYCVIEYEANQDNGVISVHVSGQSCFELHVESLCSVLRHRWRSIESRLLRFLQKHNLIYVFLMHAACKTILRLYIEVINITVPCFVFADDADRDGLCAAVRFSWLNFRSEIRLYHTYFPNCFTISAAIISTISSFIFTHIQPTRMKLCCFNLLSAT